VPRLWHIAAKSSLGRLPDPPVDDREQHGLLILSFLPLRRGPTRFSPGGSAKPDGDPNIAEAPRDRERTPGLLLRSQSHAATCCPPRAYGASIPFPGLLYACSRESSGSGSGAGNSRGTDTPWTWPLLCKGIGMARGCQITIDREWTKDEVDGRTVALVWIHLLPIRLQNSGRRYSGTSLYREVRSP